MFGPNGSGDALGTWLILMLLGAGGCLGGGLLAFSGRWRRWYRPVDSPIRYAPLAAIPFGAGCLIELVAIVVPPPQAVGQVVAVALFVCLLLSLLLFLRYPALLRPAWVKRLDLETPVAVRDDDAMERNLARMAALASRASVRLRPHAKTHKSVAVGRRQLELGAAGLTVATLQEAEVFAGAGVRDLVVAHPPVGAAKLSRLAHLAARLERLAVSLDDAGLAREVSPPIEILWEVDTGLHRVGTPPGEATLEAVRRLLEAVGQDRFRGLLTHGGHAYRATDQAQRRAAAAEESEGLAATAELLRASGIEVREVSVGSTPTAGFAPEFKGVTEIRPGTYVYGDAGQVTLGSHALEDCALVVVASVVSAPAADRCVLDCGSKSISADRLVPGLEGYGMILGRPDLTVARLSEEHTVLTAAEATGLMVGDRVAIIPAHVCTTANLHPYLLAFDSGGRPRWEPVDARGWR